MFCRSCGGWANITFFLLMEGRGLTSFENTLIQTSHIA
jgi:hypothetical protein